MNYILLLTIVISIFTISVFYCDLKYRKIYNFLTLPVVVIGLSINTIVSGLHGLAISISGMIVGLIILLIPFILGWIGGGDVKFLMAAGSLIGPKLILYSTLGGLILCSIPALIYIITHKRVKIFISQLIIVLFNLNRINELPKFEISVRLPIGVFLAIGTLFTWLYFMCLLKFSWLLALFLLVMLYLLFIEVHIIRKINPRQSAGRIVCNTTEWI